MIPVDAMTAGGRGSPARDAHRAGWTSMLEHLAAA